MSLYIDKATRGLSYTEGSFFQCLYKFLSLNADWQCKKMSSNLANFIFIGTVLKEIIYPQNVTLYEVNFAYIKLFLLHVRFLFKLGSKKKN